MKDISEIIADTAQESIELKHTIDTAKTEYKKKYFRKKLKKNNEKLASLLTLAECQVEEENV